MIDFSIRHRRGLIPPHEDCYFVEVEMGNTSYDFGMLSVEEARDLAETLRAAADQLEKK